MKIDGAKLISVEKSDLKDGFFKIPKDVRIIGSQAFIDCKDDLEVLEIPSTVTSILENAFISCNKLKSVKLSNGITNLRRGTFANCTSLENITLPQSLVFLNPEVFVNCSSLKSINIPTKLNTITAHTFDGCSSLENVNFEGDLKSIFVGAFANCTSLKQINIPDSVTEIQENAFENCTSLKKINLPSFVGELGYSVFKNCKSLESITIPKGLVNIREDSFNGCENLKNVSFLNSVVNIKDGAFKDCKSLKKMDFPFFVRIIGDNAFENCVNLKEISMQDKVEYLGKSCFKNCSSLEQVTLSKNLIALKDETFYGCKNLKKVEIPKSIKMIGNDVFTNCNSIENLFIPNTITKMGYFSTDKDSYLIRENDGFVLSTEIPKSDKQSIKINNYKGDLKFLNNHWTYKNLILNEQKDPKILDFYNTFLTSLDEEKIDNFLDSHNFKFFKQLEVNPFLPNKKDLYGLLYNLGAFKKPINDNGKNIDYSQKVVGFLLEKLAKNETDLQTLSKMGVSMEDNGFNKEYTDYFMKYFDMLAVQEKREPGFTAKCYNRFDDVQKTNTSDHGDQRQLKPTIDKFINFFAFEKFDGVTEETKDIATTISKYFNSQESFEFAKIIDNERKLKHIKNNILKKPLKEKTFFENIDEMSKNIAELQDKTLGNFASIATNEFSYEWLEKNDPQNFILGKLCQCCAHLQGAGFGIMHASIVHPNVQNLIIRNKEGEIIAKSTLFVNKLKGYGVCNNVEVRRDISEKDKNKIFEKYILGIKDFAEEYNKEHRFLKLKQINVGMGFNDLSNQINKNCKKSPYLFEAIDYAKYGAYSMLYSGDSSISQYIIWENQDKKLKYKDHQKNIIINSENEKI